MGDSNKANEGTILIEYNDDFGYVCDNHWDINDGHVICKELGFEEASNVTISGKFGDGFGYFLDNVDCVGNESSLLKCAHSGFGNHSCNYSQVAGVICKSDDTERLGKCTICLHVL